MKKGAKTEGEEGEDARYEAGERMKARAAVGRFGLILLRRRGRGGRGPILSGGGEGLDHLKDTGGAWHCTNRVAFRFAIGKGGGLGVGMRVRVRMGLKGSEK